MANRATSAPPYSLLAIRYSPLLGGVDPAQTAPQRAGGARQQHAQVAQALELAVDRNARQRREMIAMLGEQDAGSCRHAGPEAEIGGERELARARRGGIAHRIGEMLRPHAERRLDGGAAH